MEFSQILESRGPRPRKDHKRLPLHNNVQFSPCGTLVAYIDQKQVTIRLAEDLEHVDTKYCQGQVESIAWSPNSQFLLCKQYESALLYVFDLNEPTWSCLIDEGVAGLECAWWAPDSVHVVTASSFQIRLTVWNVADLSSQYIRLPKFSDRCVEFSHDGDMLAVVQRHEGRDYLGVYATGEPWRMLKQFELCTYDVQEIGWSPTDNVIVCVDSAVEYHVAFYTPDGKLLGEHRAYEHALGIKSWAWSPGGEFLSVASYDGTVRVFSAVDWETPMAALTPSVPIRDERVVVYNEQGEEDESESAAAAAASLEDASATELRSQYHTNEENFRRHMDEVKRRFLASARSHKGVALTDQPIPNPTRYYPVERMPFTQIYHIKESSVLVGDSKSKSASKASGPVPDDEVMFKRMGVSMLGWSCDSRYLFSRSDDMPCTLWIWDTLALDLVCVMNHMSSLMSAAWHPTLYKIAMVTLDSKLYIWSPDGCSIVDIPAIGFKPRHVVWHPDGISLMLVSRMHCCYVWDDNEDAAAAAAEPAPQDN